MPSDLIGTREAAAILGKSVWYVTRKAKAGKLPAIKLGHDSTSAYAFDRADIERHKAEMAA